MKQYDIYALLLALVYMVPIALVATLASAETAKQFSLFMLNDYGKVGGILMAVVLGVTVYVITRFWLRNAPSLLEQASKITLPSFFTFSFDKKSVFRLFLVIMLFWAPVLFLVYPGATKTDTLNQIYQFMAAAPTWYSATGATINAEFIDHHPVFDTFIMGACVWLGRQFGSDNIGMFFYTFLQTSLLALSLATSICYASRLRLSPFIQLAALVFIIVVPVFPGSAVIAQKDSLFAAFLVLYIVLFFECILSKGTFLSQPKNLAALAGISCLCILSKKTGFFAILLCGIALFIYCKKARFAAMGGFIIPLLISLVLWPSVVYPLANVAPGGSQEIWGLLFQQSIAVVRSDKTVTQVDKEVIDSVLDLEKACKKYRPYRTDEVKRYVRNEAQREDYYAFLRVWARLGLTHPASYIKSALYCVGGLVVPSTQFTLSYDIDQKSIANFQRHAEALNTQFAFDAYNPNPNHLLAEKIYGFYDSISRMPVISLFLTTGFWGGWVPAFLLISLCYFHRRDIWGLIPLVVNVVLLLICPAPMPRYVVPILFASVPAFFWCSFAIDNSKRIDEAHPR